jgi:hypothetical protein
MSSKGKRSKETRGQYVRCRFKPCKRKAVRGGLCALHAALAATEGQRVCMVCGKPTNASVCDRCCE